MFSEHDTMTMRFVVDGVDLYWRDQDPLSFSELCANSAVPPTNRRTARRTAPQAGVGGFRLPHLLGEGPSVIERASAKTQSAATRPKRGRRRRRREHEHVWDASYVPGGIERRVCQVCRQVSIDLTDPDIDETEVADVHRAIDLTEADPEAQVKPTTRSAAADPWYGSE